MIRHTVITMTEGKSVSARLRTARLKHQGICEDEGKRGSSAFLREKRKRQEHCGQHHARRDFMDRH